MWYRGTCRISTSFPGSSRLPVQLKILKVLFDQCLIVVRCSATKLKLFPSMQKGMSSSLSAEMITTRTKTRKTGRLFHAGQKGRYPHSSAKNFWMEERASSFPGTRSTGKFTRMHLCISLGRKARSLNISRNGSFLQDLQRRRQQELRNEYNRRSLTDPYQNVPALEKESLVPTRG